MSISASLVMELRERTGAGMMECKKYLIAADGDIEKAILEMRKSGGHAEKKSGRVTAEGRIATATSSDNTEAVILEVNCETDFVGRDSNFEQFSNQVAKVALSSKAKDIETLSQKTLETDKTVEQERQELIAKIGENIQLRRLASIHSEGTVGQYVHGSKIGVLVTLSSKNETLAKDIAMHIAASKPLVVKPDQVPAEAIKNEREVFTAQASESGKPQEIIEKMIDGRIKKFLAEVSLLEQPFVKDSNKTIGQLLKENNAEVLSFIRFEVGEGIEKKKDNFVEEVMAQVRDK
jgi:elongation factor Ts